MKPLKIGNKKPFRFTLGDRGEAAAWQYLHERGYRLIEKNFRCRLGEIDVIAGRDGRIAFVEVKTRRTEGFGLPEEAVDRRKQQKLLRLAEYYIREKGLDGALISFDVLSIKWRDPPSFRLIQDAFGAEPGK